GPFVALALTGLGAIVVAVLAAPGVRHLIGLIVLRVRDWLGLGEPRGRASVAPHPFAGTLRRRWERLKSVPRIRTCGCKPPASCSRRARTSGASSQSHSISPTGGP